MHNWAGNVAFRAERIAAPTSVDELQALVVAHPQVRVLGSGHSFNEIVDTPGLLVSLANLPAVVEVDTTASTATVSGGLRYSELGHQLQERGLALRNLGSLPHISVAGSVATATHGSGDANRNLAAAVSGVELLTASGETVMLRRSDDSRFDGVVVALGALGVVTRVTLDVQPTFDVHQQVYVGLAFETLLDHFDEVTSGAYSVSLFTDWRSSTINQVWLKRRTDDPRPFDRSFFGALQADGPRHPVPGMAATSCTEQLGIPGPWFERLPHFRPDFTPSSGEELQAEYFVPRHFVREALAALDRIKDSIAPVLQISEIRTIAADEMWLSPCYQRDSVAVHFTWVKDADAVRPVLEQIEASLEPYEARPHWGKVFAMSSGRVASSYPRLGDFRRFTQELDPEGKFRNNFVQRYVFAD